MISTDVDRKLEAAITTFTTLIGSHYFSVVSWIFFTMNHKVAGTHVKSGGRAIVKMPRSADIDALSDK